MRTIDEAKAKPLVRIEMESDLLSVRQHDDAVPHGVPVDKTGPDSVQVSINVIGTCERRLSQKGCDEAQSERDPVQPLLLRHLLLNVLGFRTKAGAKEPAGVLIIG